MPRPVFPIRKKPSHQKQEKLDLKHTNQEKSLKAKQLAIQLCQNFEKELGGIILKLGKKLPIDAAVIRESKSENLLLAGLISRGTTGQNLNFGSAANQQIFSHDSNPELHDFINIYRKVTKLKELLGKETPPSQKEDLLACCKEIQQLSEKNGYSRGSIFLLALASIVVTGGLAIIGAGIAALVSKQQRDSFQFWQTTAEIRSEQLIQTLKNRSHK